MFEQKISNICKALGLIFGVFTLFFVLASPSQAAVLSIGPAAGTFTVGSTFDVSVYVNTEGKSINAVQTALSFPPDKLQLVSPSAGKSVIGVWTVQPSVNNQTGRLDLQGGIPGGINVSSGLVTTLTFRVKSVGTAVIKFLDDSRVLLNDGKGTNDLNNSNNGVFSLVLPPPAGPIVSSETHFDQSRWYNNPNVVLSWAGDEQVEGYSYEVSSDPTTIPDDISDGQKTLVSYRNLGDGLHYFHIKALRKGTWGGTTHFAVKIDTTPPAEFKPQFIPSARTTRKQPIIQFETTDAASGLDHYELKLIPLSPKIKTSSQPLFIEVTSPYIPQVLDYGGYDVLIRAYDEAGNVRDVASRVNIVTSAFEFVTGDGVQLSDNAVVPWKWFLPPVFLFIVVLFYIVHRLRKWHAQSDEKRAEKILPEHIKNQLKELSAYRQKYGKVLTVLLLFVVWPFFGHTAKASSSELPPPYITTLSRSISNQDIFYIGGRTDSPNTDVIIHLQNLQTGETLNNQAVSDKKGEWFYRHDSFLPSGKYIIWVQTKLGEQQSPPSPQDQIEVKPTALQFGGSRISYEFLYLLLICILFVVVLGLLIYIIRHAHSARKKHKLFMEEVRLAEESVRRGFAVIKRDLEAELKIIHQLKLKGDLSRQEAEKEKQLVKDIEEIEEKLGKEIWQIEHLENA